MAQPKIHTRPNPHLTCTSATRAYVLEFHFFMLPPCGHSWQRQNCSPRKRKGKYVGNSKSKPLYFKNLEDKALGKVMWAITQIQNCHLICYSSVAILCMDLNQATLLFLNLSCSDILNLEHKKLFKGTPPPAWSSLPSLRQICLYKWINNFRFCLTCCVPRKTNLFWCYRFFHCFKL